MLRTWLHGLFLGAVLAVLLARASGAPGASALPAAPSPPDTIRVLDDAGRVVVLPRPARRIVSLVPALTETLFAIGAGDRLVGRTRFDRHPPSVRAVPHVGDGLRPSAEAVRSLDPDLVLLYAGPDNRGVVEELERVGLRILAVRHDRLEDLERNVRRLGRLTGREAASAGLVGRIEAGLRSVGRATAGRPRPTVYYDVWWKPPITVGAGSYLDSLFVLAGARNAFADLRSASPQVSLESIAARDPDLILWPLDPSSTGARLPPAARPGWEALRAVRRGAVRRVDGDLVHRLGPRVVAAAAELAGAVHPELADRLEAIRSAGPAAPGAGRAAGEATRSGVAGVGRSACGG